MEWNVGMPPVVRAGNLSARHRDTTQRLVLREIGLWRIALAMGLFVLMLIAHRWAFGTSPLAGL
jgi:hypothetical protein